jgi:TonB family protein
LRLAVGMLVSVLFHGFLLLLQFGVPGVGVPDPLPPLTISLASKDTPPAQEVAAAPVNPVRVSTPKLPPDPAPLAAAASGMTLVDPVAKPEPVPVKRPRPPVRKKKTTQSRRVSTPSLPDPAPDPVARVIAQDKVLNDTVVAPAVQPEEALEKSLDPLDAQLGTDEATDASSAIAAEKEQAEVARAQELAKASLLEETERKQREMKAEEEARAQQQLAEQVREKEALELRERQAAVDAAAKQAEQTAQAEQAAAEQRQRDEAQRKEGRLATEASKQAEEQTRRQQLADKQKADELALAREKAEQLTKQQAEQQAKQQAEQQAKQQAEQLAKQQADQLAKQQAEQKIAQQAAEQKAQQEAARKAAQQAAEQAAQQAAQQAAAQKAAQEKADQLAAQRARDSAGTAGRNDGPLGNPAGTGNKASVPNDIFRSDAANRARQLTDGLDILKGKPPRTSPNESRGRRRAVVGAGERDVSLRMYGESWRQKIERNGALNYRQSLDNPVSGEALVSVAIRSDGSVEEVTLVRSSGHPDMDEAVMRIVRINARYSPFPAHIASQYDVIDVRRVWRFSDKLTLVEELL